MAHQIVSHPVARTQACCAARCCSPLNDIERHQRRARADQPDCSRSSASGRASSTHPAGDIRHAHAGAGAEPSLDGLPRRPARRDRRSKSTACATSAPTACRARRTAAREVAITVKRQPGGRCRHACTTRLISVTCDPVARARRIRAARGAAGRSLLMITAGSGITPVMSMLRDLPRERRRRDVSSCTSAAAPATRSSTASCARWRIRLAATALVYIHTATHGRLHDGAARSAGSGLRPAPDLPVRPGRLHGIESGAWPSAAPARRLHCEHFGAPPAARATGGTASRCSCARSGTRVHRRGRAAAADRRPRPPASSPSPAAASASARPASAASAAARSRTC